MLTQKAAPTQSLKLLRRQLLERDVDRTAASAARCSSSSPCALATTAGGALSAKPGPLSRFSSLALAIEHERYRTRTAIHCGTGPPHMLPRLERMHPTARLGHLRFTPIPLILTPTPSLTLLRSTRSAGRSSRSSPSCAPPRGRSRPSRPPRPASTEPRLGVGGSLACGATVWCGSGWPVRWCVKVRVRWGVLEWCLEGSWSVRTLSPLYTLINRSHIDSSQLGHP
eukprot:scaffold31691_cov70-Phaeocystis_antarctica.AAC.2